MIWSSSIQIDWTLHKQRKSSERAAKELECHLLSIGSNLPSVIQGGFPKEGSFPNHQIRSTMEDHTHVAWLYALPLSLVHSESLRLLSGSSLSTESVCPPVETRTYNVYKPLRTRTHAHSPHSNRSTQHTMGDVGSLQWSGSSFAGRSTSAQHISAPCSQILFGWAFPWPLLWWQPMFCTSVFKYILWTAMAPPRFRYQSDNLNIGKENHWILTVLGDKSKIKITILEGRKHIRCWIRFENQQTLKACWGTNKENMLYYLPHMFKPTFLGNEM